MWPTRHPGVVLDGHAACLGRHWFHERGYYRHDGVFQYPVDLARRHEASNGAFRGGDDRLMPTARRVPSPLPVKTPAIARRTAPIPPLRVADRYVAGIRHGRMPRATEAAAPRRGERQRARHGAAAGWHHAQASCKATQPGNRWHTSPALVPMRRSLKQTTCETLKTLARRNHKLNQLFSRGWPATDLSVAGSSNLAAVGRAPHCRVGGIDDPRAGGRTPHGRSVV